MSDPNPYASPAEPAPGPTVELEPPQEVRYQLVEEDVVTAMEHMASRSPEFVAMHRKWRLVFLVLGGVFCMLALGLSWLQGTQLTPAVVPPAIIGLLLLYRAVAFSRFVSRQTRKRAKSFIKAGVMPVTEEYKRCEVSHEGATFEEPMIRSWVGWPKVLRIAQTNEHLLFYLQPSTPVVIPGRAFSSEAHFEGFCRLAKRLWEEHHEADAS